MSKLLQRLSDASKSGVYRAAGAEAVLQATQGSALRVAQIDLAGIGGKQALLERIAGALHFPAWFGGNWDALEDCLTDLSWARAGGYVLLFDHASDLPADETGILIDVLAAAAAHWAGRGTPFFGVFIGAQAALPALYRDRA
jgi:hypothetical protein